MQFMWRCFSPESVGARDSSKGQQSQQKPRSGGHVNNKTQPNDSNKSSDEPRSSNRGRQQQSTASAATTGNRRRPYPTQYYSRGGYSDSYYYYNDNYYSYGNQRYSDKQGKYSNVVGILLTSNVLNNIRSLNACIISCSLNGGDELMPFLLTTKLRSVHKLS